MPGVLLCSQLSTSFCCRGALNETWETWETRRDMSEAEGGVRRKKERRGTRPPACITVVRRSKRVAGEAAGLLSSRSPNSSIPVGTAAAAVPGHKSKNLYSYSALL